MKKKKGKVGYTTGVFDLFHVGHLEILKKAKSHCDYLIVGISTDELVQEYKNTVLEIGKKLNINNYNIAVDLASFPDQIRGFGHVKKKNIKIAEECRNNLMNVFNESK